MSIVLCILTSDVDFFDPQMISSLSHAVLFSLQESATLQLRCVVCVQDVGLLVIYKIPLNILVSVYLRY